MAKKNEEIEVINATPRDDGEEYVTFTAPPPTEESDEDLYLSVNGENIRIRRGETVKIKKKFVYLWEDNQKQKQAIMEAKRRAKDLAGKPIYL